MPVMYRTAAPLQCLRAQARELAWSGVERRAGPVGAETSRRIGDGTPSSRTPGVINSADSPSTLSGRSCAMSVGGGGVGEGIRNGVGSGGVGDGVGGGSDRRSASALGAALDTLADVGAGRCFHWPLQCLRAQARELAWNGMEWRAGPVGTETSSRHPLRRPRLHLHRRSWRNFVR